MHSLLARRVLSPRHLPFLPLFGLFCLTIAAHSQITRQVPTSQYPTIQSGIIAAQPGDKVAIAPGTYYENINFLGKAITVTSLYNSSADTIIDGGGTAPVVTFNSQETHASILSYLTIRNGGATPGTVGNASWGGIFTTANSNPTILNNTITANACNGYFGSGSALLIGNTISGTLAPTTVGCSFGNGAAVYFYNVAAASAPAQIILNTIENNRQPTPFNAGAIVVNNSPGSGIEFNTIRNNAMTGFMAINTTFLDFSQNLVYGNVSTDHAGGMYVLVPFAVPGVGEVLGIIENNTFAQNTGITSQVDLEGATAQFDFVNNIVAGNSSAPAFLCSYPPANTLSPTPLVIDHNDIFNASGPAYGSGCPDQTGTYGNISADPRFTNPATFDFHLGTGSPAIDAGNNGLNEVSYLVAEVTNRLTDPEGNPRLQDATGLGYPVIDMGTYESQGLHDANITNLFIYPSTYQVNAGTTIGLNAFLASLYGPPTGAVTFVEDGNPFGSSMIAPASTNPLLIDLSGTATITTHPLVRGIHTFIAKYPGQSPFVPATSIKIFILANGVTPTLTLTSSANPSTPNQTVTFTATLTSSVAITGPVTLTANGIAVAGTPGSAPGTTIFTTSFPTTGTFPIVATYAGDDLNNPATATLSQQVIPPPTPTFTTITCAPPTATVLQTVQLSIGVTSSNGVPTGSINLTDAGAPVGQGSEPLTNGSAVFGATFATVGTHLITATYVPTGNFTASSATCTETITAASAPTTSVLTANPTTAYAGQPITLTDAVAGTTILPTGTVTFSENGAGLTDGTATLDATGHAVLTTSSLSVGTHSIFASYPGNAAYSSGISNSVIVTILALPQQPDFTLTPAKPTLTLKIGSSATTTLTVTSLNGFTDSLVITCSNLPTLVYCVPPSPNAVSLAANGTSNLSLTLTTVLVPVAANHSSRTTIAFALLLSPLGLIALGRRRRTPLRLLLLLLAILPAAISLNGCGGDVTIPYVPTAKAGTYIIPVTATGATTGTTHSVPLTLTVTQ